MTDVDGGRSRRVRGRRDALRAIGGAVGLGAVLRGGNRRASAASPARTAALTGQYAGRLSGTLHYAGGGAGGVREATDTTVAHPVRVQVLDRRGSEGGAATDPVDLVLLTTPEVTEPQEGDVNIVTGSGGGASYWTVEFDPATGRIGGLMAYGGGLNDIWVWWFGYSGAVVPEPIAPPSSFTGALTADSLHLELSLADSGVEHLLRATVDATRVA